MNPVALYVRRPYASVEEYLEAEAWTIDARAILLLDQPKLEPDTSVVFDLCLTGGVRILRAEGRVAPSAGDGLKVRFRRYSTQAKAFIERAILAREEQLAREAQTASSPPPAAEAPVARVEASTPTTHESRSALFEKSGIRLRKVSAVAPPAHRDALLERLRQRR